MNWQVRHPELPRKSAVQNTATGWGRGKCTAENIIRWEKSWIKTRTVIPCMRGKHAKSQSMLNDEGTMMAVRDYIDRTGERMYFCLD